jgi:hypothetical protein
LPIALVEYTITNDVPSSAESNLANAMESMKNPSKTWDTADTVLAVGAAVVGTAALIGLAKMAVDAFTESGNNQAERRRQNDRRGSGRPNNNEECLIS